MFSRSKHHVLQKRSHIYLSTLPSYIYQRLLFVTFPCSPFLFGTEEVSTRMWGFRFLCFQEPFCLLSYISFSSSSWKFVSQLVFLFLDFEVYPTVKVMVHEQDHDQIPVPPRNDTGISLLFLRTSEILSKQGSCCLLLPFSICRDFCIHYSMVKLGTQDFCSN